MPTKLSKKELAQFGISLFFTYLSVAMALPVVSMFVIHELHLSNWHGGIAVGISFLSTIFTRKYAGTFSDTKSSKKATIIGIGLYILASLICLITTYYTSIVYLSFFILLIGRLILGLGESMVVVGLVNWSISSIGEQFSGKILSIVGMAMYGSFAAGGAIGLFVYDKFGFSYVMILSIVMPLIGYIFILGLKEKRVKKQNQERHSFFVIIKKIWNYGMVICLQGVGFAIIGAFISIYFKHEQWPLAGFALSLLGIGFVLSRILFSNLPDRLGGFKVALFSISIEAIGLGLLYFSSEYHLALIGSFLTGFGCSMIYPAMGVELVKVVSSHMRGTALGAFSAFQDLSYALSAPIAGIFADYYGYSSIFLFGFLAAVLGIYFVLLSSRTVLKDR